MSSKPSDSSPVVQSDDASTRTPEQAALKTVQGPAASAAQKAAGSRTKKSAPTVRYDCSQCPGYCCSYPRIEVKDADLRRLARHFELSLEQAERKFTRIYRAGNEGPERILRHQKDTVYGSICRFFDTEARHCTIYAARPAVCRQYPNGSKCGYYDFIRFERRHQGDDTFIPSA
jgi:uncharacterized protein